MFNTPESAVAAVHHYESQPEVSAQEVEGVAEFITSLLARRGRLDALAERAYDLHAEAVQVALDSQKDDADETNAAFLGRLALADPAEAGILLEELSRAAIETIANEHYDEFAQDAQEWAA